MKSLKIVIFFILSFTAFSKELLHGEVNIETINGVNIHSYIGNDETLALTYIIESENKLVVINVQHMQIQSKEIRDYINSLNKLVDRVIVTNSRPDHQMGLNNFDDLDTYATKLTIENIKKEGLKLLDRKSTSGLGYPDKLTLPKNELESDFIVDGIKYEVQKVNNTDNSDEIIIKIPSLKTIFLADLVQPNTHLSILNFTDYETALENIIVDSNKYENYFVGHNRSKVNFKDITDALYYIREARNVYN